MAYNKETFIQKAKEVHGNKYDYSKVDYIDSVTKVSINCIKHGNFEQSPVSHLRGFGCKNCGFEKSKEVSSDSQNSFLQKAISKHGDKYDYSKVLYINSLSPVNIICKEHGEFKQIPQSHLRGRGCPACGFERSGELRSYNTESFIAKIKKIQGDLWDYSQLEYKDFNTKVKLICKEHGEFYKNPRDIISRVSGCPKCSGNHIYTTEEYIEKAKLVHGNKYNYNKTKYIKAQNKVIIICPKHGEFEQVASGHITSGYGCPMCKYINLSEINTYTTDEFITMAKQIHGDKYDYSKVVYKGNKFKVIIICKKHGEFEQAPGNHINQNQGCPTCNESKGEEKIASYLKELEIYAKKEYKIPTNDYKFDFFLPFYNIFIEFHGQQHYEYSPFFHKSKEHFFKRFSEDKEKEELVKQVKGKLIIVNYIHLEKGILEQYLKRQLIRYGVLPFEPL